MSKAFLDEHLQLLTNEPELEDFIDLTRKYIEDCWKYLNLTMNLLFMLIAAVVGGGIGWIGNYFVQSSIHLKHRSVDDLKRRLYEFMEMSSVYWINGDKGGTTERHALEARIIANQQIIMTEYSLLEKKQRRMRKSYQETKELTDDIMGFCNRWMFSATNMEAR